MVRRGIQRQRLGKEELALLEEVSAGDMIFGFLTSAGSTTIAHRQARRRATKRLNNTQKQAIHKRLLALEKKNLIYLEKETSGESVVRLTDSGRLQVAKQQVVQTYQTIKKDHVWDEVWRIVMFDIPQERKTYRWELRQLLLDCGFVQVQQSVYVAPYPCKELREYIMRNRVIGSYVHIIKGEYVGDDARLREKFGLTV